MVVGWSPLRYLVLAVVAVALLLVLFCAILHCASLDRVVAAACEYDDARRQRPCLCCQPLVIVEEKLELSVVIPVTCRMVASAWWVRRFDRTRAAAPPRRVILAVCVCVFFRHLQLEMTASIAPE